MLNLEPHSLRNHFSKVQSFSASCAQSCLKPISEITSEKMPCHQNSIKGLQDLADRCLKQNFNFSSNCT
ncbi:hypothetical protein AB3S75_006278 [Citrus x aurantiifolia]